MSVSARESRDHISANLTTASERFTTIDSPLTPAAITEVHDPAPQVPKSILNERQTQQQTSVPFPLSTTAPSASNPAPANIPNTNGADPESIWQASLHQMLASPEHFQQVLQTFATPSQSTSPTNPISTPSTFAPPPNPAQPQQTWPYPYSFVPPVPQAPPPNSLAIAPAPVTGPTPQEAALLSNAERLNRTYQHAGEIDADVNNLQTNLQALIHSMGLDPQNMNFPTVDHPAAPPPPPDGLAPWQNGGGDDDPDFLNSFLAQLAESGTGAEAGLPAQDEGPEDFSAFLDIPALDEPARPASPGTAALSSPLGTKRKIEAVEVPEVQEYDDGPLSKKKR